MTRKVHLAAKVSELGVSAKCFKRPRAIDMTRDTWSTDSAAVTCAACKAVVLEALATSEPQP